MFKVLCADSSPRVLNYSYNHNINEKEKEGTLIALAFFFTVDLKPTSRLSYYSNVPEFVE